MSLKVFSRKTLNQHKITIISHVAEGKSGYCILTDFFSTMKTQSLYICKKYIFYDLIVMYENIKEKPFVYPDIQI